MSESEIVMDILLVEDNATDAELCMDALKKCNLANNIVWVKDGAAALALLLGNGDDRALKPPTPKVVLLDLRLPKVNGLEVLRRVRENEQTRKLPVVVMTSSNEDRDVNAAYELGVNSFINKPIEFEEFAEVTAKLGLYWLVVNRPPA